MKVEMIRKAAPWVLPSALTAVSLGWSVYAIGDILDRQAPEVFAYSTAVLYDAVWLYALAQETAHRRQGSKTTLPQALGWVFLPLTVLVLLAHGLMESSLIVAAVGAVIPILAKMTLLMAVDRDTTQISTEAQERIDAIRSATRDQVAIGRAVNRAKAARQRVAAALDREEREALGQAQRVRHEAAQELAQVTKKHPVSEAPQIPREVPILFSDEDLARVLGEWSAGDTPAGVTPVTPQVTPVTPGAVLAPVPGADDGGDTEGVTPPAGALLDAAAVAGVKTPEPGEALTDDQVAVVLRWLRHSETPPMSYRKARAAYRDHGFVGKEERVRRAWADLMSAEEEMQ